jgi:hypothetical protein
MEFAGQLGRASSFSRMHAWRAFISIFGEFVLRLRFRHWALGFFWL